MNSPREVYVHHKDATNDASIFEVRFHDGYQKIFKVHRSECIEQRCSPRDLLEIKIIDFYIDQEGSEPHIHFFFS